MSSPVSVALQQQQLASPEFSQIYLDKTKNSNRWENLMQAEINNIEAVLSVLSGIRMDDDDNILKNLILADERNTTEALSVLLSTRIDEDNNNIWANSIQAERINTDATVSMLLSAGMNDTNGWENLIQAESSNTTATRNATVSMLLDYEIKEAEEYEISYRVTSLLQLADSIDNMDERLSFFSNMVSICPFSDETLKRTRFLDELLQRVNSSTPFSLAVMRVFDASKLELLSQSGNKHATMVLREQLQPVSNLINDETSISADMQTMIMSYLSSVVTFKVPLPAVAAAADASSNTPSSSSSSSSVNDNI